MKKLESLRKKLDTIDSKIFNLIVDRFKIIEQVSKVKNSENEIIDNKRIEQIIKKIYQLSKKNKINPTYMSRIWQILIQSAIEKESEKISNKKNYL